MIRLPNPAIVVMIGPSASGKSTWAQEQIAPYGTVVSSDAFRSQFPDEDNKAIFERVKHAVEQCVTTNSLVGVDATNLRPNDRAVYRHLAADGGMLSVAVVCDASIETLLERNSLRDEPIPEHAVRRHHSLMEAVSKKRLRREGWDRIVTADEVDWVTTPPHDINATEFDVIGEVQGCYDQLIELLGQLGYDNELNHPDGRYPVFIGNLGGVGPDSWQTIRAVSHWQEAGRCSVVRGKEEVYLERGLRRVAEGKSTQNTVAPSVPVDERDHLVKWLHRLPTHLVIGDYCITHAAMRGNLVGRMGRQVEQIATFGSESAGGERLDWTLNWDGIKTVYSGRYPSGTWEHNTYALSGAGYSHALEAISLPQASTMYVQTPTYAVDNEQPVIHVSSPPPPPVVEVGALSDMARFSRRRTFSTPFGSVKLSPQKAQAGLSAVIGRDMQMPYYAPTISPVKTSDSGELERPEVGIAEYRERGCQQVCLEAKHMGSRLIILIDGDHVNAWTRSGRPLRADLLTELTPSIRTAIADTSLDGHRVVLDGELLPWSALADGLMTETFYAAADAAWVLGTASEQEDLVQAGAALRTQTDHYRGGALSYAPFAVLAIDDQPLLNQPLAVHHAYIDELTAQGTLTVTARHWVHDQESEQAAVAWWEEYCHQGGEGAMIKPAYPPTIDNWWPPMLKCRGREYLRLVYGVEYLRPDRLESARGRSLGRKRAMQREEYALASVILDQWCQGEDTFDTVVAFCGLDAEAVDTRL